MDIKIIKKFFNFIKPYIKQEVLLFILMFCGIIISLSTPWFLKIILDEIIPSKDYDLLYKIIAGIVFLYVLRVLINFSSDYLSTWIGNSIVNDIKSTLFNNLMNKPIRFFDQNASGDLIQRINHETHKIQSFLSHSIIRLVGSTITLICLVIVLCIVNYKLFLVSIIILPISIGINKFFSKKIIGVIKESSEKEGELYNYFIESLKNIKLIKIFLAQEREHSLVKNKFNYLLKLYTTSTTYSSLGKNGASFFISLGTLIVLGYGGSQVISGTMTIGGLVAFIQYLNRIYGPANDLTYLYVDCIKAQVSMERVLPLLNREKEEDTILFEEKITSIKIQSIGMKYNQDEVLSQFTCSLETGKSYAFVGKSGSGKSTLLQLLCKYYKPCNGKISINNNYNLTSISSASWLKNVVLVHQDPLLFDQTIHKNLLFGNPSASLKEINEVLDKVLLRDFIQNLSDGLDTKIGDGTSSILLSGGQKQQLCLARALLKKASVIILDEATSAMDSKIEEKILSNIYESLQNHIIIIVSHRLSSIKNVDQIFYLSQGKIKEEGTHNTLLKAKKKYYELFKNQLEYYNVEFSA